ncbi:MAG: ADP-ribosylation factor-like protein [Candidatus Sumerlaeia bacterium]|nr:ADP-ribosylation factor-like protein [Candidatus Sumerlaeia bacterium]
MPILNYKAREIVCKIVYFGPSLGGKTTSIKAIYEATPDGRATALQTIQTEGDSTLFFDYFSLDLGQVAGMRVRFQIYGVPGQPFYRQTRKMVLMGVDGIVFVADSARHRLEDNVASMTDLKDLLAEHGYNYADIPMVMQYNKRDLENPMPIETLEFHVNERKVPAFESVATQGQGVREPFKAVCMAVIQKLTASQTNRSGLGAAKPLAAGSHGDLGRT